MGNFAVTITCRLNEKDESYTTLILDTVEDTRVTSSSTMTTHPIASGEIVADHIFNEPDSISISGTFSLNGNKCMVIDKAGYKLSEVEEIFEKIKREGILCDIVKVHYTDNTNTNNNIQFKHRTGMVLTNISWTEKINSVEFSFDFNQALIIDVKEKDVSISDTYAPNITNPKSLNFTDVLIDWSEVDEAVMTALINFDLIEDDFITFLKGLTSSGLIALGVAAGIAIIVSAIPFVGQAATTAATIIGAAIVIGKGLYNIIKSWKDKYTYKIKQFRLYKNDTKNKKEVQRFCNFEGEIHKQLDQLNKSLKVYAIAANEPQECILTIDNIYYNFKFKQNNITHKYSLEIECPYEDLDQDNLIASISDITSCSSDISQCLKANNLFRTVGSGSYVYLLCNDGSDRQDLTNYYLLISDINMEDYNNLISDIIKQALVY